MKKVRIAQVEPQFAQRLEGPWKNILQELDFPVPLGYRLRVSLHSAKRRKKPSNAAADNWSPKSSDRAEIWFEPASPTRQEAVPEIPETRSAAGVGPHLPSADIPVQSASVHPAEIGLVKALERAEARPGWSFVPLKKFRDEILPSEPIAANASKVTDVEWQNVLRSAIEKKLVLLGKVPNPKSPQFPVTTLRLNRLMPEVQRILGKSDSPDLEFHPVEIRGEPLSTTILRERR
jgi:hypothetical protein